MLAALAVLVPLTVAVSGQRFLWGEVGLLEAVNDLPPVIGWPLRVVMQLGTWWAGVAAAVVVAAAARARSALVVLAATAIGYRADNVAKAIMDRPRPAAVLDGLHVREDIGGYGYPSGHATMAFALAAAIHPVVPRSWRWVPWTLAALVGMARMYVAAHWPADVLAGAALGIAIGSTGWLVVLALQSRRRHLRRGR